MTDYIVTIRDIDQSIIGSLLIAAASMDSAVRQVRNALHWRPFPALPMVKHADLQPSPMPKGYRPQSRVAVLRDSTGSEVGRAWIVRRDGKPFGANRK